MNSQVEDIKNRLDIAEVIQGYLKLQKAGANWKGSCPFHHEKTPSFVVTPARQIWHCFGCGEGGDVFSFVQKMEGLEFYDVLKMLAEKAGVKLIKHDQDVQLGSQRKKIYEISELATKFFERQLLSRPGLVAVEYLKERGVTKESLTNFRIGWAPDTWQSLHNFLSSEGYTDDEIDKSGLAVKSETTGEYHDRFRHRIMFPIADSQGQVIGFTGRIFEKIKGKTVHEDAGKYVNTPSTILYDKSQALYGLDKSRTYIRNEGCILLEGTMDVLMSHQAGIKNVVATCGTAFGVGHARIIKRYTEKLMLAFDADEAGDSALKKGVNMAIASGLNVSVVSIPSGKDTADTVKENPKLWTESVLKPVPYLAHIINRSLKDFSGTLESKKSVLANVLPFIKSIVSPLDRDYWLEELSHKAGVARDVLNLELRQLPSQDFNQTPQATNTPIAKVLASPKDLPGLRQEEYLLSLLLRYPDLKGRIGNEELELFSQPNLFSLAQSLLADNGTKISDSADSRLIAMSELIADFNIDPEDEFARTLVSLKKQSLQSKLKVIQADIKKAEADSDSQALNLLLKEFGELSQKLLNL
ncbi:MAG: DNA primase [bacterium]|nr:DNA primase [bacterium]